KTPIHPTSGPTTPKKPPVIGPMPPSKLPIGPGRAQANTGGLPIIDGNTNTGGFSWAIDTPPGIDPEQQILSSVDFRQAPAIDPLTGRVQSSNANNSSSSEITS